MCIRDRCIETVIRQHVHFVNQIDFESAVCRLVVDVLKQGARIFHLGARSCVDFNQVDESSFADAGACAALIARRGTDTSFAIDGLGQDSRQRCLANPARAGEQVCVVKPIIVQSVGKRAHNVALPNHLFKFLRAPFPR